MNDMEVDSVDLALVVGYPAWQPHPDADDVDAMHIENTPRIGTFRLAGADVLFLYITGGTHIGVWAYTVINPSELRELAKTDFNSLTDLQRAVLAIMSQNRMIVAVTQDELVRHFHVVEQVGGDPLESVADVLDDFLTSFEASDQLPNRHVQRRIQSQVRELEGTPA